MPNLIEIRTEQDVDKVANSIKQFLQKEKEVQVILAAWGTKEGMVSFEPILLPQIHFEYEKEGLRFELRAYDLESVERLVNLIKGLEKE